MNWESKLSFLVGLPRAGKNSYAIAWAENGINSDQRIWISRDDVRLVLHGKRFDPTREKEIALIYENAIKTTYLLFQNCSVS